MLLGAVTLSYPVAIYFLLREQGARALALPLCLLAVLRVIFAREWLWGAVLLAMAVVTALTDLSLPAKFYPVAVNLGLFVLFGRSLLRPPSFVERIARLREPDLPPPAVAYTRRVTMLWCVFFLVNAMIAAWLALFSSDASWAMYSGGIAYACAGLLFAGEFVVRRLVRQQWNDG